MSPVRRGFLKLSFQTGVSVSQPHTQQIKAPQTIKLYCIVLVNCIKESIEWDIGQLYWVVRQWSAALRRPMSETVVSCIEEAIEWDSGQLYWRVR